MLKKYLQTLLSIVLRPKNPSAVTIRERLRRSLIVYVIATFAVSFIIAGLFGDWEARSDCARLIKGKIEEARIQVRQAKTTRDKLSNTTKNYAVGLCELVAQFIRLKPSVLTEANGKGLENLCADLDVSEIEVVDENGIVEASYPPEYVGLNYDSRPELQEFLRLLYYSHAPVVQDVRPNVNNPSQRRLYAGVARKDKPGFIEIGIEGDELEENILSLGSVNKFVPETSTPLSSNGLFGVYKVFDDKLLLEGGSERLAAILLPDELKSETTITATIDGQKCFVYAELHDDLWYVGAASKKELSYRGAIFWSTVAGNFAMITAIFALVFYLIERVVVRSVYRINGKLEKITNGNLDERVEVRTSKEFADLSSGIDTTVDSLKQAIDEVKRKAEEELRLAQRIQAAALPDLANRYSKVPNFEVFGVNRPMHRVGGDMYDFFFVDVNRAFFYVADVSGHGVAAALFMMKAMALVKNLALSEPDLAKVVSDLNRYLSENNETMFVTGFFCSIDLSTGKTTYVNAGHNPPLIRRKGGNYQPLEPEINLILGVEPEAPYVTAELQLEPDDALLLYTDGITEATAPNIDCFEMSRTLDTLNASSANEPVKETIQKLFAAVDKFTNNAEPSDDETVLLFKFCKYADEPR